MWYQLTPNEVERKLETRINSGLDAREVAKRLATYGPNKLPDQRTDSPAVIFLRQFQSPLIFILCGAAVVLYFLGERTDSLIVLVVLIFNALVGAFQEGRAQNTVSALTRFVTTNATVLRENKELIVPDTEVVPGDILILEEGEKVPADARIVESHTLTIDEAALTGESHPIHKVSDAIPTPDLQISEQKNIVFKGSYIVAGNGMAIAVSTGIDTIIGKISQSVSLLDTEIPLKANIRYLSRAILAVVAGIITALFIGGVAIGKPMLEMFKIGVSLAVSIIPEGLPIVLTIVLVTGVFKMAKRNALVKRLQAVEALGQARIIAVDKTGTITKNEMVLKEVRIAGKTFEVSGSGYDANGAVQLNGESIDPLNHPELVYAGKIAAFCANAHITYSEDTKTFQVSGDPTDAALLVFAQKIGFHKHLLENESPKVTEIPFDYNLKYHASSHRIGTTQFVAVVGAPEVILSFSKYALDKEGTSALFSPQQRTKAEETFIEMSGNGLRVVACAMAELPLDVKIGGSDHLPPLTLLGFYGIHDGLREGVTTAVAQAQDAGVKVVLITGDHAVTAAAIAKEAGIFKEGDRVLTGSEIDTWGPDMLAGHLASTSVFARVTPEHKLKIVQAFKHNGDIIAMTGDGINDAPSLVAADLGIAMGRIGTDVAKEASDIILLDDNFSSITAAIEEGRNIYKTIKKVILYLFSTSLGEVLVITGALALGYPLPILAAQILWLNLVTDGVQVLALAVEPKEQGLLKKNFERPKKYLIDKLMVKRMFVMAIPMMLGSLYLFQLYFPTNLEKAMTISLTVLAVFQWLNAWNCRSEDASLFTMNPFSNRYLFFATILSILLQCAAIYTPFMQNILKTVPLDLADWTLIIITALSIIVAEETRKLIMRSYSHVS